MAIKTWVNIGSGIGLLPDGFKLNRKQLDKLRFSVFYPNISFE